MLIGWLLFGGRVVDGEVDQSESVKDDVKLQTAHDGLNSVPFWSKTQSLNGQLEIGQMKSGSKLIGAEQGEGEEGEKEEEDEEEKDKEVGRGDVMIIDGVAEHLEEGVEDAVGEK